MSHYDEDLLSGSHRWRADCSAPCYAWAGRFSWLAVATASPRYDTKLTRGKDQTNQPHRSWSENSPGLLYTGSNEQAFLHLWLTIHADDAALKLYKIFSFAACSIYILREYIPQQFHMKPRFL